MSIFDRFDNALFNLTGVGKAEIDENKANRNARKMLPSVTEIEFWKFSDEQIAVAESVRPALGYAGEYKKFIESLKDGSSGWLDMTIIDEVTVQAQFGDIFEDYTYGRVRSLEGQDYREFVLEPPSQKPFFRTVTDKKFTVKPCYLVHYFIGDNHGRYLLLSPESQESFDYIKSGLFMDLDHVRDL